MDNICKNIHYIHLKTSDLFFFSGKEFTNFARLCLLATQPDGFTSYWGLISQDYMETKYKKRQALFVVLEFDQAHQICHDQRMW